jgi:hypothetical protein
MIEQIVASIHTEIFSKETALLDIDYRESRVKNIFAGCMEEDKYLDKQIQRFQAKKEENLAYMEILKANNFFDDERKLEKTKHDDKIWELFVAYFTATHPDWVQTYETQLAQTMTRAALDDILDKEDFPRFLCEAYKCTRTLVKDVDDALDKLEKEVGYAITEISENAAEHMLFDALLEKYENKE